MSTAWPRFPSLSRTEVRKASALLRGLKRKLPKHGYCVRVSGSPGSSDAGELCRDKNGYFWRGKKPSGFAGTRAAHATSLKRHISLLHLNVVAAGKALGSQNCIEAFDQLLSGVANMEIANTENIHANSNRHIARAGLDDLLGRFVKQCVRK